MTASSELARLFELLESRSKLGETGPGVRANALELKVMIRQIGSGGQAALDDAMYTHMQQALDADENKRTLLGFLDSQIPSVRSWSGGFIEQLLSTDEAVKHLSKALQSETDAEAASWFCLSLARLRRHDRAICGLIQDAYTRFEGKESVEMHIARALGYAGCSQAEGALTDLLQSGGFDQQSIALDGLGALRKVSDKGTVQALWKFFRTTRFDSLRQRCANVLTTVDHEFYEDTLFNLLDVLAPPSDDRSRDYPHIVIDTLRRFTIPPKVAEESLPDLIQALRWADDELGAKIVGLLEKSYPGWENTLVEKIVEGDSDDLRKPLARALGRTEGARDAAVKALADLAANGNQQVKDRVAAALKEIGGEEAFESASILEKRYIEPSNKLEQNSRQIFEDTIRRMQNGYDTSMFMSRSVFIIGVVVIIASLVLVTVNRADQFFGAAGVIAGLGTLVTTFYAGPLEKIQKAMADLIQVEVAFTAFMHRLLQARSIFEQQFYLQIIDIDALTKFDKLFNENMLVTMELLEKYSDPAGRRAETVRSGKDQDADS